MHKNAVRTCDFLKVWELLIKSVLFFTYKVIYVLLAEIDFEAFTVRSTLLTFQQFYTSGNWSETSFLSELHTIKSIFALRAKI